MPTPAACATAIFLIERRDTTPHELYNWLLIIIRTGVTNIADYLKHKIACPVYGLILSVSLAGVSQASLQGGDRQAEAEEVRDMPRTGMSCWAAMLGAGVFGTFFGDVAHHLIGQGETSLEPGLLLTGALAIWNAGVEICFWFYWMVVAVARTRGTAMGDWFAETDMLSICLPLATLKS